MIYCILGETSCGKDSIFKRLSNHPSLTPIVTTTSRPPRSAEKDGIDYNFVSDGEFMDMVDDGSFMEWTTYTVANGEKWFYGTEWEKCNDKDKNYIVVVNPEGLGTYIRTFGNRNESELLYIETYAIEPSTTSKEIPLQMVETS